MQGLPSDEQSSDSAIIAMHCGRVPLFIDPQRQAEAWLRHKEAARGLRVVSASQPSAVRTVAHCARMGMPCLVTDVAPGLDPALAPLCALADSAVSLEGRKHHTADAPVTVRIGGSDVRVAAGFSLYLATDRAAEEITPATAMLVAVVEFGVSRGALEEQLLAAVVRHERPSLEAQREALEQSTARDMKALHEHEEQTLHLLQVRRCCRPTAMKLCTRSRVPMHGVHACACICSLLLTNAAAACGCWSGPRCWKHIHACSFQIAVCEPALKHMSLCWDVGQSSKWLSLSGRI